MSGIKKGFNRTALNSNSYNVFIDGKTAITDNSFLDIIAKKFNFPYTIYNNWQAYIDGMTELDWVNNNMICIVVYNWNSFLSSGKIGKEEFLEDYFKVILPSWETEAAMPDAELRDLKDITLYITELDIPKEFIDVVEAKSRNV